MKSLQQASVLLAAALSTTTTTMAQDPLACPTTLSNSHAIDALATLHYAVVPSSPPGSNNGILCGRLEVEHDGFIALAFSESGAMQGSDAIVGLPGAPTPLKYDLVTYGATAMMDDKQTLRDASLVQDGEMAIMTFTKLLVEDGEVEINEFGVNAFLHARGGDALEYHGSDNRLSFNIDFGTEALENAPASAGEVMVGDEVCITNYIMDKYCIDLGRFLDDQDSMTLAEPENHSFHCLLDVPRCSESGYLVLTDKNPDTDMHCLGYRLEDTAAVQAAGFAAGRDDDYCTGCTGDESKPTSGYIATVKGTVKELGDGSIGTSGTPLLENIEVLDESVGCDIPTVVTPVCMPIPAPVPPPAPEVMVGDEVCITNYIMDKFCIDLGVFKDDPSTMTLQDPEKHSFHCLLDVEPCWTSGYLVLTDKNAETGMHCLGYRLNNTTAILEAGFAAGRDDDYCTGCTGDESKPTSGYRATIKGTVKELGDGSVGTSGAPLLENIRVLDASVECDIPTVVNPVCMPIPTPDSDPADQIAPVQAGPALSCPDSLDGLKVIGDLVTLHYAMVPSDPPGSNNGILCGRLEVENDGFIALGFSETGKMEGSDAIVGIPGDDTVLKYELVTYGATAMADGKQTLRDASIDQDGDLTIMEFTKLLVEPGEVEIKESGTNIFLNAWGGATLQYHGGNNKLSFNIDFAAPAVSVGDRVCITNYIMDKYCIDLGNFLDDQDSITLAEPENHSFHCLLDVPLCRDSGYLVLTDKNPDTDMHCLGYRLDDTAAVLAAGFAAGRDDEYCTGCTGDASKPTSGYIATVKGTVKELGDGTSTVSGTPLLEDIEVLDPNVECDIPTVVNPVCLAPPAEATPPAAIPVAAPAGDCSKEFCVQQLAPDYSLGYKINVPDDTTLDVCAGCTISMVLTYDGEAWVGIAFSENGEMIGSQAVLGSPDAGVEVQKYNLGGKSTGDVTAMPEGKQTLTDTSLEVANGQTIMKFTKIMKEEGEIEVSTGDNTFLWAYGTSNALGPHAATSRAAFELNLSSGASEAVAVPNMSAWLAHGIVAFLAWGVFVPFAVQSSLLRDLLPSGPIWFKLHRGFNATAYALFVVAFAVGVAYVQKEGGVHFDSNHERMGLAMFILASAQVLGGVLRPHVPAPDSGEEKTQTRKGWEVGHRVIGVALLACGFWQMQEGLKLYADKYSVSDTNEGRMMTAYWTWIAVMSAIIVFGGGYFKYRKNNAAAAPAETGDDDVESP